jgi:hypothetical protein
MVESVVACCVAGLLGAGTHPLKGCKVNGRWLRQVSLVAGVSLLLMSLITVSAETALATSGGSAGAGHPGTGSRMSRLKFWSSKFRPVSQFSSVDEAIRLTGGQAVKGDERIYLPLVEKLRPGSKDRVFIMQPTGEFSGRPRYMLVARRADGDVYGVGSNGLDGQEFQVSLTNVLGDWAKAHEKIPVLQGPSLITTNLDVIRTLFSNRYGQPVNPKVLIELGKSVMADGTRMTLGQGPFKYKDWHLRRSGEQIRITHRTGPRGGEVFIDNRWDDTQWWEAFRQLGEIQRNKWAGPDAWAHHRGPRPSVKRVLTREVYQQIKRFFYNLRAAIDNAPSHLTGRSRTRPTRSHYTVH